MLISKAIQLVLKVAYRATEYRRGLWIYLLVNLCGGTCEGIPRVGKAVFFKYPPHSGMRIGRSCDIGSFCYFDVPPGGKLTIGNNVKMTAGVVISAINEVVIGDDCLIAEWVSIRDAQHNYLEGSRIREQGLALGSILIESDVWIGRSSAVFMGATLEKGCVVGAGTIIKRQRLQQGGVYAGMPPRKISERKDLVL